MPQLPSSDESAKLLVNSSDLAETRIKDEKKIEGLLAWLRNDLGVKETCGEENVDAVFVRKVMVLCKMNVKRSKHFLVKYFKARSKDGCTDFFQNRNAESDELLKSCQSVYFFGLPDLTKDGNQVMYVKLFQGLAADDFDPKAFFKRFFMISDIRLKEENDSKGDIFILDLEGFTSMHAVKLFSNGLLQRFVKCLKETYPRRVQAIYLLNSKPWHKTSLRMFLKMVRSGRKNSSKFADGSSFPIDMHAGKLQDLNDVWTRKMISYSSWFRSLEAGHSLFASRKKFPSEQDDEDSLDQNISTKRAEIYTFKSLEGVFKQLKTDDIL